MITHASIDGRTAIVTGACEGIGAATAHGTRAGARVALAVRNPTKTQAAIATWKGRLEIRSLDLADLESVRAFARAWHGDATS